MWKDPIVEEVHEIRRKLAAECGHDPRRRLERQREVLKQWKGKAVTKEELLEARKRARQPS